MQCQGGIQEDHAGAMRGVGPFSRYPASYRWAAVRNVR